MESATSLNGNKFSASEWMSMELLCAYFVLRITCDTKQKLLRMVEVVLYNNNE